MSRAASSPLPRFKEYTERRGVENLKVKRRSEAMSNTKSWAWHSHCPLNLAAAVPVLSIMERGKALKATLLPECLHAANVARRERDIFFGNIVTGKLPCSCDQTLIHSSLSKPNETHWAIQRKRGRIKRRGKKKQY